MRRLILFGSFSIAVFCLVAVAAVIYTWDYYHGPGPLKVETNLVFESGTPFNAIVEQLGEAGVITHPILFKIMTAYEDKAHRFKAGEYAFTPRISPQDVAEKIAGGKVVVHKLTIREGIKAADVAQMLKEEELLKGAIHNEIREGSLLPETYYFHRGETRAAVIGRMQEDMELFLEKAWENREPDLPINSKEEALILASIVEKETGYAGERKKVAAVFINRLRIEMPLQSDPTVTYGMEKEMQAPLGRPLTRVDLKTPTDYNTYTNKGLPPTPIALPGKKAIRAVLHPAKTKDLYFVASGEGGHNFSTNLQDHNRHVNNYRRKIRGR